MDLLELLDLARERIAVDDAELDEAKRRRGLVAAALLAEFGGRVYFNGSIAHGDANDPLTDFDLGIVVPNNGGEYGPGAKSPRSLQERARDAIRRELKDEFPDLRVELEGRKRSVLARFFSSISDRTDDFTGDIIVAIEHPGEGLWIPRYDSWDRSHPEKHTALILAAIGKTEVVIARANRLLKHWSMRHDKPLCAWHLKALNLDAVLTSMPLADALEHFFAYAYDSLGQGDTPDPADVGPDIKPRVSRAHAREKLSAALETIRAAKTADADHRPLLAQAKLANLLPDIVDCPTDADLATEEREREVARLRAAGNLIGVGAGAEVALPNTRGWRIA
jgi:hypothetical protein